MYRDDIKEGEYQKYCDETNELWYKIMNEKSFDKFNKLNQKYLEVVEIYKKQENKNFSSPCP